MNAPNFWLLFATSISSGLIGALLTLCFQAWRDNRRFKVETLKRFVGARHNLGSEVFIQVLNEIFVVFNDDPDVMTAIQAYHTLVMSAQRGQPCEDALLKLYKSMCKASQINPKYFNDSFFLNPFTAAKKDSGSS